MKSLAEHWGLEEGLDFLNHGSFGACPRQVLQRQGELRVEMERQPVEFLARGFNARLDAARARLAAYLGADPDGLVPVTNATAGVNTVLRSLVFERGDELLTTNHAYGACRNALEFVAERSGARVVVASFPFPSAGPGQVLEAILAAVTPRTRLALIDHVTSPTGLVLPVEQIVPALAERGVETLVDGAHAPGMLDLSVDRLAPAWYTGNCHKWLCAPKGAAFLWARADRRDELRPLVISHGATARTPGRSRFLDEFSWQGTSDPTAFLVVPEAIQFLASIVPGGWPEIRRRNRTLALRARDLLADALGIAPPAPDAMIGSLVALPVPDADADARVVCGHDPLQQALLRQHRIETMMSSWPAPRRRVLRVAAQLYNDETQYARLAAALRLELGGRR